MILLFNRHTLISDACLKFCLTFRWARASINCLKDFTHKVIFCLSDSFGLYRMWVETARRVELLSCHPTNSPGPLKSRCITSWSPFIVNGTCYPLHHHYILILISDEIGGVAQSVSTGGGWEATIWKDCNCTRHSNHSTGKVHASCLLNSLVNSLYGVLLSPCLLWKNVIIATF